jgi:hypothetical protein
VDRLRNFARSECILRISSRNGSGMASRYAAMARCGTDTGQKKYNYLFLLQCLRSIVALRRQRSQVRILSGAPFCRHSGTKLGTAFVGKF